MSESQGSLILYPHIKILYTLNQSKKVILEKLRRLVSSSVVCFVLPKGKYEIREEEFYEYSGRIEHPGRFELNTFVAQN